MTDFPYLPADCRNSRCEHETDRCLRYRSRRCESGQCTHARQNLICAVNYQVAPAPKIPKPMGCRWCGIDHALTIARALNAAPAASAALPAV